MCVMLQSCGPASQWKTGRTTKMGKHGKFAPIENGKNMAEKYRKNGKSGQCSIFSVVFGHFFPFSIGANFPRFSHFFPIFVVRPVFHCVAGPQDCKRNGTPQPNSDPHPIWPFGQFFLENITERPPKPRKLVNRLFKNKRRKWI